LRSDEVESLIFVLISILILFPILYVLPIGLPLRGKITIIVASILIVSLSLMFTPYFPLREVMLMTALIVGIASYLIDKKFTHLLYAKMGEVEPVLVEENRTKSILEGMDESYFYIATSDKVIIPSKNIEHEQFQPTKPNDEELAYLLQEKPLGLEFVESESIESTFTIEQVAAAVQEDEETNIELAPAVDSKNEGYLGELEAYLTNDTAEYEENILGDNESLVSIAQVDINDLELQIIDAIASLDDSQSYAGVVVKQPMLENDQEDNLPEFTFENNLFDLEEIETKLNSLETEGIHIHDNSLELEELVNENNSLQLNELMVEENSIELDDDIVEEDETIQIEFNERPTQLEEVDQTIKLGFNFEDDDDEEFWRKILEDDEEDKKVSTTTDKLEKMWERTRLAK
jgi:hypothetical protein